MELRKGYIQTEVGLIPEDWEVIKIDQVIDLLTGFPFPSNNYSDSGIRLLRGSNIKRGTTDWSEDITQYWPELTNELIKYKLNEGDIVIAMDGSLVGRSFARLTKSDLPALLLQRVARIRTDKIDTGYLKEFVCSDYFTKYCDKVKTSSAIPHISPKDIKEFKIPLPPTKAEQTAISTALSDMDNLIAGLEKLIAKKKAIKQGAMQELLRPKEGWVVKKLGDVGEIDPENLNSSTTHNYSFNYISLEDVDNGVLNGTTELIFMNAPSRARRIVRKNDILISTVRPNLKSHLLVDWEAKDIICSTGFSVLRCNSLVADSKYVFYHLFGICINTQIEALITGSNYPSINSSDVRNLEIPIPSLKEQYEISSTLYDMECDINSNRLLLEKYKLLKQGMMQELLTGKTRLI